MKVLERKKTFRRKPKKLKKKKNKTKNLDENRKFWKEIKTKSLEGN